MREPAAFVRQIEENPQLTPAPCERVSGYGVMGLPFRSGHILGLRQWTASSVGPIGPLAEQAHLNDFYIPQRGIFAVGRVFVTPA
jgi:hypothetical protein